MLDFNIYAQSQSSAIHELQDDEHREMSFTIAEIYLGMVEQYAPFMRARSSLSASRFSLSLR